jgi:hypothetical protein
MIEKFKNANGTYDGAAMLAELSGIPYAEVKWTAARMKHLMTVEGKSKEDTKDIVTKERISKPWNKI